MRKYEIPAPTQTEIKNEYYGQRALGKDYHCQAWYKRMYAMTDSEFIAARANGLPFVELRKVNYYCKPTFHAYYAGLIGDDVERLKLQKTTDI